MSGNLRMQLLGLSKVQYVARVSSSIAHGSNAPWKSIVGSNPTCPTIWRKYEEDDVSKTKTVWIAYTNTDCTEGRGYDIPIVVLKGASLV